jgi:hypothetical protein
MFVTMYDRSYIVRSWVQLHTTDDQQRNQHQESDLPVTDMVRRFSNGVL